MKPLYEVLALLKVSPELKFDEQHSVWQVSDRDATQAERVIGVELAAQPENKKLRVVAKEIARYNHPPFTGDQRRDAGSDQDVA